jgi:hypothetical protein
MPSVICGPGNREGQASDFAPRPSSSWECLASHVQGLEHARLRRTSMLMLRVVCGWRLEDVGILFGLHKGHVCREVERARLEMAAILHAAGIDLQPPAENAFGRRSVVLYSWITRLEHDILSRCAKECGRSRSQQARLWIRAGGLDAAVQSHLDAIAHRQEQDDAIEAA